MRSCDLMIIGGGPAGLAAAVAAYDNGVKDIVIVERDERLGGVLNQCIHNGFGLTRFKESLTGPEYAYRFIEEVEKRDIQVLTETTVLDLTADKQVTLINRQDGVQVVRTKAVILAMGCRERSKGALNIAGERPAGIYSAGTAQRYVNLMGYLPGKEIVILGSGDIGLIMARRMTLEGAKVKAVCEIMPYSSGLKRNIEQCLNDFGIPMYLNTTIIDIKGKGRVESVTIAQVDANKQPIPGTEREISCDTVLFSVGLIPENELAKKAGLSLNLGTKGISVDQFRQSEIEGIFACGNALQVHDLVDFVSEESEIAGRAAARYVLGEKISGEKIDVQKGKGLLYVLPQKLNVTDGEKVKLFFRVNGVYKNPTVKVWAGDKEIYSKKKSVVAPGEMETVLLKPELFQNLKENITVGLEYDE